MIDAQPLVDLLERKNECSVQIHLNGKVMTGDIQTISMSAKDQVMTYFTITGTITNSVTHSTNNHATE